ncbi:hypothetical protein DFH09DRAFT_248931 [Mycena vulgaris]|nr:hypothetical protein DFH09DRAFT_248931 [Mycena vulgaris]
MRAPARACFELSPWPRFLFPLAGPFILMTSSASFATGRAMLYLAAGLVVQTFFFGAYTIIIFLSTRMLMRRGLKARVDRILLIATLFMYIVSAANWGYSFADVIDRIQNYIGNPNPPPFSSVTKWLSLFNAIVLVNYVLSDGVVVWRARLICSPDEHKYMYFPLFLMVLGTLCVAALIGLRIASVSNSNIGEHRAFVKTIDTLQISALGLSVLSNLSATGVVGITAWRHRRAIRAGFYKTTKGNKILSLLLESGLLYCISSVVMLVSALIRLPYNTLGDLVAPINVQVAGAYTPILLLLASTQSSSIDTNLLPTIPDSPHQATFRFSLSSPAVSNRPVLSIQFAASSEDNADAEVYPGGLKANQNEKGHRYQVSDATLV